ncbi:MAG: hypothetical protein HY360_25305 [Verrucomicrobia bacterium]|nr:hypothetical protein [Verrucomicrobiota bacterium]
MKRVCSWLGFVGWLATAAFAEEAFPEIAHPERQSYDEAARWMAERKYEQAALAYGRFLGDYGRESALAARAAFERAQCLLMQDKTEDGTREMIAMAQRHPQAEETPLALWIALQFFIVEKADKKQAWFYAEQILKNYPNHPLAERVKQYWPAIEKMTTAEMLKQAKLLKSLQNRPKSQRKREETP